MPNHQVLFTASDGWGYFFFLTCSPILDLGHFSQMILPIVLQIMPPPKNNPNHQVLFTASDGWGFFLTCSPILDLGHFSQVILPIVLQIMPQKIIPTIRCCEQHLMVGVNFFFDLFSHSGLRAFFTSDFANCTTNYAPKITPTIRCCEQHLMVGVIFFLTCSPILDLGHFSQVILPIVLQIMPQPKNNPNHQVLWTASDGWG